MSEGRDSVKKVARELTVGDLIEGQLLVITEPRSLTDEAEIAAFKAQMSRHQKTLSDEEVNSGFLRASATDGNRRIIMTFPAATEVEVTERNEEAVRNFVRQDLVNVATQAVRLLREAQGGSASFSFKVGAELMSITADVGDDDEESVLIASSGGEDAEDVTDEVQRILREAAAVEAELLRAAREAAQLRQQEAEQQAAAAAEDDPLLRQQGGKLL